MYYSHTSKHNLLYMLSIILLSLSLSPFLYLPFPSLFPLSLYFKALVSLIHTHTCTQDGDSVIDYTVIGYHVIAGPQSVEDRERQCLYLHKHSVAIRIS